MQNILLLTRANLRKNKGQTISFLCLIIMASALMNLGFLAWFNYDKAFDAHAQALNSANVIISMQNSDHLYQRQYEKEIMEDSRIAQLEQRPMQFFVGTCIYGKSETTRKFALMNTSDTTTISQLEFVDKATTAPAQPIYLPYLFKSGGGYEMLDTFTLTISGNDGSEKTFTYQIGGFFEEAMLGTINSTTTGLLLDDMQYQALSASFNQSLDGTLYLVKLQNDSDNEAFATNHLPQSELALSDVNFYDTIKQSRTITSSIGSMLIVAFAIIIASIGLIVVHFRISNAILEDMKNIGALKAIGYTGKQIASSIILQFLFVVCAGCLAGTALAYVFLPMLSMMFAAQTGVIWNQGFDMVSASITCMSILGMVFLVSWFSTRKARSLTPIVALRSGVATHNFSSNPFPLHQSKGNLSLLLAGKSLWQNGKSNLLIALIVIAISFAGVFASVMYYNISYQFDNFLKSTSGEVVDILVEVKDDVDADTLLSNLKAAPDVQNAYFRYNDNAIRSGEDAAIMCYTTEDFADYENQQIFYEGRYPKHGNEVAIGGLLANLIDKEVGDKITLIKGDYAYEYLITGLIQGSDYMGHDAALTEAGYHHIHPSFQHSSISIQIEHDEQIDQVVENLQSLYGDEMTSISNNKKVIEAAMGSYRVIVGMLVLVIGIITLAIIALTLYLIIKTFILHKKMDLGIQKAIGYTTRQLVIQTSFSFLPTIFVSSILGSLLGYWQINPLLSILFSGIGMMKVNFTILPSMLIFLCLGITSFGFLVSILVAMRIRKITPYQLLHEE